MKRTVTALSYIETIRRNARELAWYCKDDIVSDWAFVILRDCDRILARKKCDMDMATKYEEFYAVD